MQQYIRYCTTTDGVRIAYTTSGSGPPLVRVHGWLSHLEFDTDGPIWTPWAEVLGRRHELVRYDGRGMGLSDRQADDFGIDAKLRDLEAVISALGEGPCALLGLSEGAGTALAYAVRHPERVERLVLVQGMAYNPRTADYEARNEALQALIMQGWGSNNPAIQQFFSSSLYPDADREFHAWFVELQRASTTPSTAARFLAAYLNYDLRELLPQVAVPTLVLHRRDASAPPLEAGRELATGIPDAEFQTFAGRNHLPLPREPACAEMVAAAARFLARGAATDEALSDSPTDARPTLSARGYPDGLTAREVEVLQLLVAGESNAMIAATLVLSVKTVERHLANIYRKIGARSRVDASTYAMYHELAQHDAGNLRGIQ